MNAKLIKCTVSDELELEVADLSGESDYLNQCDTYAEASALIAECADSPHVLHPLDWPAQRCQWQAL